MKFNSFIDAVKVCVSASLPSDYDVVIEEVMKNNGTRLVALCIKRENQPVTPTIYLEPYYREFKKGFTVEQISKEIISVYQENSSTNFNLNFLSSPSELKKHIAVKIINYESNVDILEVIPFRRFLDLAIVYYIIIESDTIGMATSLIYNKHMEALGLTEEELYEVAIENSVARFPAAISSMEEVILDMVDKDSNFDGVMDDLEIQEWLFPENSCQMFVLTNNRKTYGAVCMLYKNVLSQFAREINSDLYLLPSSIHEVILIPTTDCVSVQSLEEMVVEINMTEVKPEERLSNHVYLYSRNEDKIFLS